jgi:hypothetical protein
MDSEEPRGRPADTIQKPEELEGYVALLDILGFSSMAESPSGDLAYYTASVQEACKGVDAVLFSDSIVLTVEVTKGEHGLTALKQMLEACSGVMGNLITLQLACRGAIAFGRYLRLKRQSSVFIAGRPIVEAYNLERRQDWLGVTLCRSVVKART